MTTVKRTLYAVEGDGIEEKETQAHSETARKVYVPVGWIRVVINNTAEGQPDGGIRGKLRKEEAKPGGI